MIDPDNRTEERVSVPLFRYLFSLVVGITCLTFAAGADIPPPCSIAEVSKKVERQTAKWERNAKQYNKLESVLAKIDRALTNNNYSDCDLARVHMARLNVQGMSETYDEAIPALQDVLSSTEPSENPEWSENVVRLSLAFRAQGDFDNLARLTNEYASDVHGLDAAVLERSLFLAKIGLGEPEAAYSLLVNRIRNAPETLTRWDLSFGYALAQNLGRTEDAISLETVADENFGGLWRPDPLPLLDGDALVHLLARETDERYFIRVAKPPSPSYPGQAAERGIEGFCDVGMDIGVDGKPKNVMAVCTNRMFVLASEKAVRKMNFEPLVIDGTAYEMPDYIYPLEYTLAN